MKTNLSKSELAELERLQSIQMNNPPASKAWQEASKQLHAILEPKGLGKDARGK